MVKANKLGKKKNKSQNKPAKGKKKAITKGKKEVKQISDLENYITRSMKERYNKGPRPLKVLQDELHKWMDMLGKKGKQPIYVIHPKQLPIKKKVQLNFPLQNVCANYKYKRDCVKWKTMNEKRKGQFKESPINIEVALVIGCKYKKLDITGLLDYDKHTYVSNSGHTVRGTLSGEAFIAEGPLFGKYKFENFHLHYGESSNDGTEHSINGTRFTLELHIEFSPYSCDGCDPRIVKSRSRKALLALLFEEVNKPCVYELFSLVSHIPEKDKKLEVANNLLYDFREVLLSSDYYNYSGSSTDYKMANVEWIIFKKILPIYRDQMRDLRKLRNAEGSIKSNVLFLKPIGNRKVFTPVDLDHIQCRGKDICDCYQKTCYCYIT